MAIVPRVSQVDQQPAGVVPGQFQGRSEAAPFDFGQSAARALESDALVGRALAGLGQQLDRTGGVLARQAILDQEVQNDTEATEAVTGLSRTLNEQWAAFSELQGQAATQAFPAFQERVRQAGQSVLEGTTNPRVRQMLAGRVSQLTEGMIGSATAWNTRQTRIANAEAQVGLQSQAIQDGMRDRLNPQGLAAALDRGLAAVGALGRLNGWAPERLQQQEAEFRGRFYSGVIASVAETDPLAGQRMFDAVRNQLDPAAQVRIENMLSSPVRQRVAQDIVRGVTQPSAEPDSPGGVRDRIFRAENPAGDARRNPNSSASGPGQITDETWRAYAGRLGLTDAQRNDRAAHERIFDAYMADAQRTIGRPLNAGEQYAAWFLGIGAAKAFIEAAPGTNARELYMDVLRRAGMGQERAEARTRQAFTTNGALLRDGMTTGQVLEAVAARVGSVPRQDNQTLLRAAMERAGPDPQLQAEVFTQFNRWNSVMQATQAQDRAAMERRVQETGRALEMGASVSIPEAEIRRVFQPEQADRILDSLYTQQIAGQVFSSVQLGTPAELQALREDLRDGSGPVSELLRLRRGTRMDESGNVAEEDRAGDVAARGEIRRVLDDRIDQRNRQLTADPAQFVLADPNVREAATRAAAEPQNPQAMQNYVTATLAAQQRLGVPQQDQRVLSRQQSQAIVADLLRSDPGQGDRANPDSPALRLRAMQQQYGEMWPRVFQDLVRDGSLPQEFQVLAVIPSAVGQADYARMLAAARQAGGMDKLDDALPQTARDQIRRDIGTYTEAFTRTATASGQSGGGPLASMVHNAVRNLAIYYTMQGVDPSTAMQRAADRIINDRYEIQGTMRVPRTTSDGRPLGLDPVMRAQADTMRALTPEGLDDLPGNPQVPPDERRNIAWRAAQRGFWVPNERDTGLVLMMELENGGRVPVRRQGGARVELMFDNLPQPAVSGARTIARPDGLIGDGATGAVRGDDPDARARANAADRAGLRTWRQTPEERRAREGTTTRPPQPAPQTGGSPPVRDVLPGERRGERGSQPRGRWEPPQ